MKLMALALATSPPAAAAATPLLLRTASSVANWRSGAERGTACTQPHSSASSTSTAVPASCSANAAAVKTATTEPTPRAAKRRARKVASSQRKPSAATPTMQQTATPVGPSPKTRAPVAAELLMTGMWGTSRRARRTQPCSAASTAAASSCTTRATAGAFTAARARTAPAASSTCASLAAGGCGCGRVEVRGAREEGTSGAAGGKPSAEMRKRKARMKLTKRGPARAAQSLTPSCVSTSSERPAAMLVQSEKAATSSLRPLLLCSAAAKVVSGTVLMPKLPQPNARPAWISLAVS
mmetsp:Transcript_10768/g.44141  ORF Transcript_10768/g.44141 Transcript_10768/m.44141 type:complete len:295 (+) Transcript_10768:1144-2028(+)